MIFRIITHFSSYRCPRLSLRTTPGRTGKATAGRCAGAPVCQCAGAPVRRCAGAPMRRCADAPMRRCAWLEPACRGALWHASAKATRTPALLSRIRPPIRRFPTRLPTHDSAAMALQSPCPNATPMHRSVVIPAKASLAQRDEVSRNGQTSLAQRDEVSRNGQTGIHGVKSVPRRRTPVPHRRHPRESGDPWG